MVGAVFVYEAEIHDGAGRSDLALFTCDVGLLGLTLEPVILDLFCSGDLLGVVETFEVVFLGSDAVGRSVGLNVAFLELLPEGKASRSTTFE